MEKSKLLVHVEFQDIEIIDDNSYEAIGEAFIEFPDIELCFTVTAGANKGQQSSEGFSFEDALFRRRGEDWAIASLIPAEFLPFLADWKQIESDIAKFFKAAERSTRDETSPERQGLFQYKARANALTTKQETK